MEPKGHTSLHALKHMVPSFSTVQVGRDPYYGIETATNKQFNYREPRGEALKDEEMPYFNFIKFSKAIYAVWWLAVFVLVIVLSASWVNFTTPNGYLTDGAKAIMEKNGTGSGSVGAWTRSHFREWPYPIAFILMIPSGVNVVCFVAAFFMIVYGTNGGKYFGIWMRGYNPLTWVRNAFFSTFVYIDLFMMAGNGELLAMWFLGFICMFRAYFAYKQEYGEYCRKTLQKVTELRDFKQYFAEGDQWHAHPSYNNWWAFTFSGISIFIMIWLYTYLEFSGTGVSSYLWATVSLMTLFDLLNWVIISFWNMGWIGHYAHASIAYDVVMGLVGTPIIFLICVPYWLHILV